MAWVTICLVWGTTYLVIRIGVKDVPPMFFAGIRWIVAGPLFYTVLRLKGFNPPSKEELKHIAVIGISLLGIANGLVVFAEQWIPSGLTALLITTLPFWIVGMESFIPSGPKPNKVILTGILLGFLGVAIIFYGDVKYLFESQYFIGIIALIGAVVFWSAGSLYSKYHKIESHSLMSASVQMMFAGIFQLSLSLIIGEKMSLDLSVSGYFSILYLILVGSILGYGSYIYAISHLPVSFVTTYAYINPIIALFLGWLVLGEKLNFQIVIASTVIILGVAMVKKGASQLSG